MNILLIVVILFAVFKIADGYKKGMVKEIISLVTLFIVGIMIALLGSALHTYMKHEIMGFVITLILLALLGLIHHLLGIVFFSAKLISKLPVIHSLNKLLGAAFGLLEVVCFLQILFFFIQSFGLGMIGSQILAYTADNPVLNFIYQHNFVADLLQNTIHSIGESLSNTPVA